MGVPSFYRWLVDKYPKIVANVVEDKTEEIDSSLPNPNGIEFDNLYLDMNGIIHPCFHPPHHHTIKQPSTFEEVFDAICEYIDRLFAIVRPRNLLYLAIDGVAPRAKMNQQRSRRFRTAKDNAMAEVEEERLRLDFEEERIRVLPKQESELLDSNIITPGTEFMFELSKALRKYIQIRLQEDRGWKNIMVILSDANVPGEGEHKIMSFIRQQRTSTNYNQNTRHCIYGLDADLIMLALATHELHFSILREDLLHVEETLSTSESGLAGSLTIGDSSKPRGWSSNRKMSILKKPYQFVQVWILREYLELEMQMINRPEKVDIDIDRVIDDFIFMCLFTGNDFLPRMPTLQINEGAIDLLMTVYKREFTSMGDYLVDMTLVTDKNMRFIEKERVEKFILAVGEYEEQIFQKRSELHKRRLLRILHDNADEGDLASSNDDSETVSQECTSKQTGGSDDDRAKILENTKQLQERLTIYLHAKADLLKNGLMEDEVRLGDVGWKQRYYEKKFLTESPEEIESTRRNIVEKYMEGLIWVLLYYYSEVPSWTWFYPFHYGPFASDLEGLAGVHVNFVLDAPFKPFDQLMGVLHPSSSNALPKSYQELMTDEKSCISDFYPKDFEMDMDGVRFTSQGICKLSFIDEQRLLAETKKLEKDLGPEEAARNAVGDAQLFVHNSTKLGTQIAEIIEKQVSDTTHRTVAMDSSTSLSCDGFGGVVCPFFEDIDSIDPTSNVGEISKKTISCVFYKDLPNISPHIPRVRCGVDRPDKSINEYDMETVLWHSYNGKRGPSRSFHIQDKYRRESCGVKSGLIEGSPPVWVGRGKGAPSNFKSRGWWPDATSFRSGDQPGYSPSTFTSNCRAVDNTRVSENAHSIVSRGSSRPLNTNFWPSSSQESFRGSGTVYTSWQHNSRSATQNNERSQVRPEGRGTAWTRGTSGSTPKERKDRW